MKSALGLAVVVAVWVSGCENEAPPPQTQTMLPQSGTLATGPGTLGDVFKTPPPGGPIPIPYPIMGPAAKVTDKYKPSGHSGSGDAGAPVTEDPSTVNAGKATDGG